MRGMQQCSRAVRGPRRIGLPDLTAFHWRGEGSELVSVCGLAFAKYVARDSVHLLQAVMSSCSQVVVKLSVKISVHPAQWFELNGKVNVMLIKMCSLSSVISGDGNRETSYPVG